MPTSSKQKKAAKSPEAGMDIGAIAKLSFAVIILLAGLYMILNNFNVFSDPTKAPLPIPPAPESTLPPEDQKVYEQLKLEQAEQAKTRPPAGS